MVSHRMIRGSYFPAIPISNTLYIVLLTRIKNKGARIAKNAVPAI